MCSIPRLASGSVDGAPRRYAAQWSAVASIKTQGDRVCKPRTAVDLMALYERHGLAMSGNELPDHLPLFLEFLSEIPEAEARGLLAETGHILEAIRQGLKKRKVPYSSVFSCAQVLAEARPIGSIVEALLGAPDDLAALDAAWQDEEGAWVGACGGVVLAPGATLPTACSTASKED
jgi:nitrate reductase delta subunit